MSIDFDLGDNVEEVMELMAEPLQEGPGTGLPDGRHGSEFACWDIPVDCARYSQIFSAMQ